MDAALTSALRSLPTLCLHADAAEIHQTLKALRRLLLIDRRRIDPDPHRHELSVAFSIRQAWLIEHRSRLMAARADHEDGRQQLAALPDGHPLRDKLLERLALLKQYIDTQEAYGVSVRSEMRRLQAELLR